MDEDRSRPFVATFAAQVCVEASDYRDARDKAVQWGMRYLTENVTIPDPEDGADFVVNVPECAEGRIAVPIAGSFSFIAESQAEANERAREILQAAWAGDTSEAMGVQLGEYRVLSGPPQINPDD
jgi:hypothetical protein